MRVCSYTISNILLFATGILLGQVHQPQFTCAERSKEPFEQINVLLQRINSFTASFEQLSYSTISSDVDFGDGEIYAKKPRNIRVNYSNPVGSTYVFSGDRAVFENKETGEKEYFRIEKTDLERLPVSFIVDGKLQEGMKFEGACQNLDGTLFNFFKEVKGSREFELKVLTDKNVSTLKGIQFKDFGGAVNSFLFSNFKLNPDLSDELFKVR